MDLESQFMEKCLQLDLESQFIKTCLLLNKLETEKQEALSQSNECDNVNSMMCASYLDDWHRADQSYNDVFQHGQRLAQQIGKVRAGQIAAMCKAMARY